MATASLGFLYPGYAAEDDFPRLAAMLSPPVVTEVVHTELGEHGDAHTIQALRDMGERDRLAAGAAELKRIGVAAGVWACTSGSFVYGWDGAHDQVEALRAALDAPASSASLAFVRAAQAVGARRVAIAATYPDDVARSFVEFIEAGGIEVAALTASGIATATEAGQVVDSAVVRMVCAADRPDADAVLVPDTALHTVAALPSLEARLGKPVLTANQVCVWEALRLVGVDGTATNAGRLFARSGDGSSRPTAELTG